MGDSVVKNLPANARDAGLIPGSGRSPGEGNGNPFQYSCLENSMDRGAWRATVHGVTRSQTRLRNWTHICTDTDTQTHRHTYTRAILADVFIFSSFSRSIPLVGLHYGWALFLLSCSASSRSETSVSTASKHTKHSNSLMVFCSFKNNQTICF